ECPLLQRLLDHRLLEAGHHHDLGVGPKLADLEEALHAIHHGHAHVHEGDVVVLLAEALDRLAAVRGDLHLVAAHLDQLGQTLREIAIIVDDHHPCTLHEPSSCPASDADAASPVTKGGVCEKPVNIRLARE